MADKNQADPAPERVISVDLNAADPTKAVSRRNSSDIAKDVRDSADQDADKPRTKSERDLYKRMGRLERNLEKQFDQRMANREAEWQRERSDMRAKLDKLSVDQGGSDDKADAAHEAAISVLKDKLAAAYEKGDSVASADITLQISKLDAQFWAKKAAAAGVVQRDSAKEAEDRKQAEAARAAPKKNEGPTVAGSRFIRANDAWWDDPDYAVEKQGASTIYARLVNEDGFDPKSDETFKEVAKQLKAKFPKLNVKAGRRDPEDDEDQDDDDDARQGDRDRDNADDGRTRRQAAAARIDDRGAANVRDRGTRRTLTAQEIKTMRDCRLDPDNDRDVVQFLREAVALESAQS